MGLPKSKTCDLPTPLYNAAHQYKSIPGYVCVCASMCICVGQPHTWVRMYVGSTWWAPAPAGLCLGTCAHALVTPHEQTSEHKFTELC